MKKITEINIFFRKGMELDWDFIESIPEFAKLKECQQSPKWHGEGNAWVHTQECLKAAYALFERKEYEDMKDYDKRILIVGVLFHDIGKGETTEFLKGAWHAYGHEFAGERTARRILWDLPIYEREEICAMVRWHMEVLHVATSKDYLSKIARLSLNRFFSWKDLIFVKRCDILGSAPEDKSVTSETLHQIDFLETAVRKMGCECGSFCCNAVDIARLFNRNVDWRTVPVRHKAKAEITVLIGLPGAGKDTHIKALCDYVGNEEFERDYRVLSRDDIRAELGYCSADEKIIGTPEQEETVSKIFNSRLKEYADKGLKVIINNLNVRKKYRDDYKRIVGCDAVWNYLYIEAPTLLDNISRRDGQISADAFKGIIEKFDWPTADEYDTFFYQKQ